MQHVARALKNFIWSRRTRNEKTYKDITTDVNTIKNFLRAHIGGDYATATQPSVANLLSVDMSEWGGLRTPRGSAPFNQIRAANAGYRE